MLRFFAFFLAAAALAGAQTRPNFVLILVDDLGRQDLGIEGSTFYETPHIDSLARRAMRFERGYSACQVCSPSRAAIQTGKAPARVRITDYINVNGANQPEQWSRNTKLLPAPYETELPLEEKTLAEALREHGYRTFFAGKWHLGGDGFTPEEQGYEINHGGYHFGTPPGGYHSPYNNPKLTDDPPGTELPHRLGKETAGFIRAKAESKEPFFAMLSFYSVHGPLQCSRHRWEKFRTKAERMGLTQRAEPRFIMDRTTKEVRQVQDHPVYAGMLAAMDDAVGLVLEALRDSGVAGNTVVIFTADNGGVSSGDSLATACLPFRGGKGRQWEGGLRAPYYIAWPGVTSGQTTQSPAIGMDFYPTILDIAGLPLLPDQHRDGVSLVPVLKGGSLEDRPLFWHYPHYGNQGGEPSAIMIQGDWKLIHYFEDGRNELYDIANDIGEQRDLAADNPERAASMLAALQDWQKQAGAKFPVPNPNYSESQAAAERAEFEQKTLPQREAEHARFLQPDFTPPGGWWDDPNRPPARAKGKGKRKH